MSTTDLPYDEWVMLETIARRVERRILSQVDGNDEGGILDVLPDGLEQVAAKANRIAEDA